MTNPRLEAVYQAVHDDPYWSHLRKSGINLVPGYGNATSPKVLLVGEAPGATENARLRPFCGPSGRVLRHLMEAADLRLDALGDRWVDDGAGSAGNLHDTDPDEWQANAFVTNVVKYRPPGNRTPSLYDIMHAKGDPQFLGYPRGQEDSANGVVREECARLQAAGSLRAEWRALGGPRVIVAVGGVAHSAMSPVSTELSISAAAGNAFPARAPGGKLVDGYWVISQLHPAYGLRKGEHMQKHMTRHWEHMGEFLREEEIL